MTPENKEKLAINVANSWKMASNWVFTASGVLVAIWVSMPPEQQAVLIAHLPVPPWAVPIAGTVIGIAARLWPQKSITPEVAEAKSAVPEPEGDAEK